MVMSSNADKNKAKEELGAAETKIETLKVDKKVLSDFLENLKVRDKKSSGKGKGQEKNKL